MRENTSSNNNVDSFYDDNVQFNAPPTSTPGNTMANSQGIKRPHSLDFTGGQKMGKRKFNQSLQVAPVLDSPDIQKLGLATPDIEKFMLNNPAGILQTPGGGLNFTPNKVRLFFCCVFRHFCDVFERYGTGMNVWFDKGAIGVLFEVFNDNFVDSHKAPLSSLCSTISKRFIYSFSHSLIFI